MSLLCHSLGREAGYFDVTGTRRGDSLVNCAIRIAKKLIRAVRRIDDHEPASRESQSGIVRMNREIRQQHFRNSQRLEARMHHAALRRAANGIPHQINSVRPASISLSKCLQHHLEFIETFVRRIDQHQTAPFVGRQERLERRIAVAGFPF